MSKMLIVIDAQNDFVTGVLGTKEAQEAVPNIVELINKKNETGDSYWEAIVLTQDTHSENYLETTEGKYLPVKHCVQDTDGWNIVPEIKKAVDDWKSNYDKYVEIINKPTFGFIDWFNVFYMLPTDYESDLYLTGFCTSICVAANASILKTLFPDNKIIVDSKATACITPEHHQAALMVLKAQQVEVV